jgi:hypothetical protein
VRLRRPGRTARKLILAASLNEGARVGSAFIAATLALLPLSPLVRLSRAAFLAFALMLLIFAVWALFGFGYPSSPLPFSFNAASKVVAFVVVLSLFLPQRGAISRSTSSPG